MSELKPHEFAELLPMMSDTDYAALKADVISNRKFKDPAVEFEGKLLDGRNRQRVSIETGIKLPIVKFKGTRAEAVAHVYSTAVHRNLGESQKAAAAVSFLPHFEVLGKQRQADAGGDKGACGNISLGKKVHGKNRGQYRSLLANNSMPTLTRKYQDHVGLLAEALSASQMIDAILLALFGPSEAVQLGGKSRDFAGTLFGVSGRYVQEAKAILDSDPKLFREVFDGRETISRAKRRLQLNSRRKVAKAHSRSHRIINPADCEVITGDNVVAMERMASGAFRLIFADPPYNLGFDYDADPTHDSLPAEDYIDLTHAWIKECARLLKRDGTLCWMVPEEHVALAQVAINIAGLHVRRLIVWHESFGQAGKTNFGRTCRFIWYATKSKDDFVFDASAILIESKRSSVYADKRAMPGGKVPDALWDFSRVCGTFAERIPDKGIPTQLPVELVKRCVRCFTEPGDFVFDPFGGTGTTARAALSLGRKCVTIDRSKKYTAIIRRELAAMSKVEG